MSLSQHNLPEKCASFSKASILSKPKIEIGKVVLGKWKILKELGAGGCGVVYRVVKVHAEENFEIECQKTDQHTIDRTKNLYESCGFVAALKTESVDVTKHHLETLRTETTVLRRMQWSEHVCKLISAGRLNSHLNMIVMTETGPSLSRLRRRCPEQRFTLSTAVRVAISCLEAIEDLHCIGFIHRDIKPSNFAIGLSEKDKQKIHLLDFGLARAYLQRNSDGLVVHRQPRLRASFIGTERYCSLNVHHRLEQGRRDDLWSLFFSIIELIRGKLPWRTLDRKNIKISKIRNIPFLLEACPHELRDFYFHIKSLDYASRPNYEMLRNCLAKICKRRGVKPNDLFDWENGGYYYKRFFKYM